MDKKYPVSEERNAVKIRSGPATVTGDESSRLSLPQPEKRSGEKTLQVM
jgi:hypothetical protein